MFSIRRQQPGRACSLVAIEQLPYRADYRFLASLHFGPCSSKGGAGHFPELVVDRDAKRDRVDACTDVIEGQAGAACGDRHSFASLSCNDLPHILRPGISDCHGDDRSDRDQQSPSHPKLLPVAPRHLGEFDGGRKARFGSIGDIAAAKAAHDAKTANAILAGGVVAVLLLAVALLAPEASHAALTVMGRVAA